MAAPKNLTTVVNDCIRDADHLSPLDAAAVRHVQLVAKKLEAMYKDPDWDPKGDSYNHLFLKLLNELRLTPASRGVIVKPAVEEEIDELEVLRKRSRSS